MNDNIKASNYTYFLDPLDTAVKDCGLASRGVSLATAQKLAKAYKEKKV